MGSGGLTERMLDANAPTCSFEIPSTLTTVFSQLRVMFSSALISTG